MNHRSLLSLIAIIAIGTSTMVATSVLADHSWGNYHWGRTSNPFTLELGDNVTGIWDTHITEAANDWSVSSILNTVVKPGKSKGGNCRPSSGRVEVCNDSYGNNGWLGIAQIWVSGSHIAQGAVKVNDTYFDTTPYNTSEWRNVVMCQEVGHTLGLGHVDEDFSTSLGTCMDYASDPGPNQHPNQHDYDMLALIYSHLDSVDTWTSSDGNDNGGTGGGKGGGKGKKLGTDIDFNNPQQWGSIVRRDARGFSSLYRRSLGRDEAVFTFVIWVDGHNE